MSSFQLFKVAQLRAYLIHAGVSEKKRGVIMGNNRAGLPEGVVVLLREERNEGVSHAGRRPAVVGKL